MAYRRVAGEDSDDVAISSKGAQELQRAQGLFVKQNVEYMEALTGFETENSYQIFTRADGGPHLVCGEKSSMFSRLILGSSRPFTLHIASADGAPCIQVERPWRFYFHELRVKLHTAAGWVACGAVKRKWSVCTRDFDVVDEQGQLLFTIQGPMFNPWAFNIRNAHGQVGCISKKFSGFAQEMMTDADNFGVEWPADLAVPAKALLLAAVFLIDFMFFEDNSGQQQMRGGRQRGFANFAGGRW